MAMETPDNVWEGFDVISKSLEKGIFLCKDVVRFYKKRLEIEEVYYKSLQKAVQKFEPSVLNGFIGTHLPATWQEIRAETEIQSSIHETMASHIKELICDPFENLILDLEQNYTQFLGEGQKAHNDAKESIVKLKKTKIGYDKLYRESMDVGGSATGQMSKRDTQRLQRRTLKLTHELIKADTDYRNQIAETNGFQNAYVKEYVPKLLKLFNKMESVRLHIFKQYLIKYFTSLEALPKNFPNSRQKIVDLLNLSSNDEDITDFLEKNKAHLAPPKAFEFEPPADDPPQPTHNVSRRVSMQFTGTSPTTSPTIGAPMNVKKSSEPLPVSPALGTSSSGSKKDGMFGFKSKKESSSPPVLSLLNSSSDKKDKKDASPALQGSSSKEKESTTPPTGAKDKEASKWWFRNKKQQSQHELKKQPSKHGVFGVKIDEIMAEQKNDRPDVPVPYLLIVLRDVVIKMDGMRTEGLFRVPGNANDVIAFKKQFNEGNYDIVTDNVHTAAALFKLWLRELPDPVFPYSLYDKCLACITPAAALGTVDQLPEANKNVLFFVVQLLRDIAKFESVNKMSQDNLAMVFAPCLLRSTSSNPASLLENSTKEKEFIHSIIEHLQIPRDSAFIPLDIDPPSIHTPNNLSSPSTPLTNSPSNTPPNHINHLNHVSELTSSTSSLENFETSRSLHSSGVDESELAANITKSAPISIPTSTVTSTSTPSSNASTPTTTDPQAENSNSQRQLEPVKRNVSLSAILEEDESPMVSQPMLATIPSSPAVVLESNKGDDSMMEEDELQAPLVMVASTTFNSGNPEPAKVNESHLVRVQVLAEAIASHLASYLQTLSQCEVSYPKMRHTSKNLEQKFQVLEDFLHKIGANSHDSSTPDASSPYIHLRPNYTAPPLHSSSIDDESVKEKTKACHETIVHIVTQFHERLHVLAKASESSSSADEVKAIKNLLKSLKTDIVERRIEAEEPTEEEKQDGTETSQTSGEGREEGEGQGGERGEVVEPEGEDFGADVLSALQEHVSSKRDLLEANEDELGEDDLSDLTDKRMTLARTLSPVKKELDQFCKECKIEVVGDSRYPVDDMNSEVKFLRKMILHVVARICYLTKEAVAHIQILQTDNRQLAKELHERLVGIIEMLS